MTDKNEEFLKKLLATFRVEADEHLQAMFSGLDRLEKTPAGEQWSAAVEIIYREAHSLKGAARAVNFAELESLCHALESVFSGLKSNRVAVSPPLFDLLHRTLDAVGGMLAGDANRKSGARDPAIAALVRQLEAVAGGTASWGGKTPMASPLPVTTVPSPAVSATTETIAGDGVPQQTHGFGGGTIRVRTEKLDIVMRQTEELLAPRLAAGQRAAELRESGATLAAWKRERAKVAPAVRAIERYFAHPGKTNSAAGGRRDLTRLLEYLEAESVLLGRLGNRLAKLERFAGHDHRALTGMVDSLLHDVREMHMLPCSSLLESFPRLVRELTRDQGKQAELVVQGGEIEIDRRILDEMKDPLIHLLRNCVDHGIEKPALRGQKDKPPQGTLTIAITHQDSSKVEILVSDDGAGIDVTRLKAAALRLALVSAEELDRLEERELLALSFRSGVSTSPIITELSGRGLGLAIVRERVERLGGTVAIETQPGAGTSFRMVLPLALATFRGVLVRSADRLMAIPALSVERMVRVANQDIRTVKNRETIPVGGQAVSLVRLDDVLELPRQGEAGEAADHVQAVVISLGGECIAFRVDAVLGEQEVLVKGLGPQLARVRNIAGASVLGTGQVVPVLNVHDLMKSAAQARTPVAPAPVGMPAAGEKRSILVVEDSITSRALLKNILESSGYNVTTAVDGIDAYTTLKTGAFDLVVSDVEMPRMDGFDLTAKIRADKQLSTLPVVLVTALGLREHRERGIDVGANAYIVKSNFDQGNLLEVIRQLI
jgi:two-component system chemotaxis sensor kinase CheA